MKPASAGILLIVASSFLYSQEHGRQAGFSAAESLMRQRVTSGIPSIAIAVARQGRIVWEEAIGVNDREQNTRTTTQTPYYLASISKTITATALMELVERGRVNLDRPVNDYLNGNENVTSPMWDVSQATVRRIANHTAGLATYDRNCLTGDRSCNISTANVIRRYGVSIWKPGEQFDYSNLDYGILGEVIARRSHSRLATSLRSLVFAPLGMTSCF